MFQVYQAKLVTTGPQFFVQHWAGPTRSAVDKFCATYWRCKHPSSLPNKGTRALLGAVSPFPPPPYSLPAAYSSFFSELCCSQETASGFFMPVDVVSTKSWLMTVFRKVIEEKKLCVNNVEFEDNYSTSCVVMHFPRKCFWVCLPWHAPDG